MTTGSNHHCFCVRFWKAVCWSGSAAALVACSSHDTSNLTAGLELEPVKVAPMALDPDQMEADFQTQVGGTLSAEERTAVEAQLRDSGVDVSRLSFVGRVAVLDDIYMDADELLRPVQSEDRVVEKGAVFDGILHTDPDDSAYVPAPDSAAQSLSSENGSCGFTIPGAPPPPCDTRSAAVSDSDAPNPNHLLFRRPDILGLNIVVPDGAAASFLVSGFTQAAAAVANAANDCLTSIRVLARSQFNALSQDDLTTGKFIFVNYASGTNACPNGVLGCSFYPRDQFRQFDIGLGVTHRLVPGTRIGINSDKVTPGKNLDVLTHELLHTLGVQHPNSGSRSVVPGSSCSNRVFSIMQDEGSGANPYRSRFLTADDKATIGALYGGSCPFNPSPRDLGPAVAACTGADGCFTQCTKASLDDLNGACCFCNGVEKKYRKSTANAITYLCQ